ncbi:MAG TPA: RpiB/LacA/LacB family sugar-phosphate isomerase [Polyangia bacterium]|jgi:ribose 5-phosphate isomerase B|nr:RpiB/LacA/LacB family sugar-phosphate isomerase [Polyangia bacterium]
MKIAIGADHAGFRYKEILRTALAARGHQAIDFGTDSEAAIDYPPIMRAVAQAVARGDCDRGIVLGGSGNGEAIVANRVRGVRCAVAWNLDSARAGRAHNDSNVLALGERFIQEADLLPILDVWLDTPFEGGRHQRRIDLIDLD